MSNAQAEYEQRFNSAVEKRSAARQKLSDVTKSISRLKADAAQANADVATIRADAKAAGVKLPKLSQASVPTNDPAGNGYTSNGGPGPEDDED